MMDFIIGAPLVIQIVMGFLAFFVAIFSCVFLPRAISIWVELAKAIRILRDLARSPKRDLSPAFSASKTLKHLWKEYDDTLHEQREFDASKGAFKSAVLRSTIPAAMVFTTEAVVDTRLATEFFKHLPGLFTGVGIIGTFWGLIPMRFS